MTTRLVFNPPGPEAPGYLRRMRQALVFTANISSGKPSPELLDEMVAFLAQYVTEPEKQEEKIEALWMASESEFLMLLRAVTGEPEGDANPTSAERANAGK